MLVRAVDVWSQAIKEHQDDSRDLRAHKVFRDLDLERIN